MRLNSDNILESNESRLIELSVNRNTLPEVLNIQPAPTDFENLIEMNSRKQNNDSDKVITSPSLSGNTRSLQSKPTTIENLVNSTFSESQNKQNSMQFLTPDNNQCENLNNKIVEMEVDIPLSKSNSASKFHLAVEQDLVSKGKIGEDNNIRRTGFGKSRSDIDGENYHFQQQLPSNSHNLNFRSSFHLYEYNQNNQNILNQRVPTDSSNNNPVDESMWRPW